MTGTWYPVHKVEVRFDGSTWTDVSADVVMAAGLNPKHGRDDEMADPMTPSTKTVTLQNDDGRYSPDLPSGSHYPYVVEGVAVRVSMQVNGSWVYVFWGTVQAWSVQVTDVTAAQALTTMVCTGAHGSLPKYTLRQAADEVIRYLGAPLGNGATLVHHWPLRDTDTPCVPAQGTARLSSNGGDGFGLGTLLPMDEGTDAHPLFTSSSGKLTLTSEDLNVAAEWRMCLVVMTQPTANGTILSFEHGGITRNLTWSTVNGFDLDDGTTIGAMGLPASWPVLVEVGNNTSTTRAVRATTVNGTTISCLGSGGSNMRVLKQIKVNPTLSGGSVWGAGHLAVYQASSIANLPSSSQIAQMLLGPREVVYTPGDPIGAIGYFAGAPVGATGLTAGSMAFPLLEGRDVADALGAIATGMGGRLIDFLNGNVRWKGFAPSDTPIVMPDYMVNPDLTWETSDVGWCTDCTVTRYDGQTYTASATTTLKRQSLAIEGVHATWGQDRSMANWYVNTASTKARLSQVSYNVSTLTATDQATIVSVKVGDRITLNNLPSTVMPATLTLIVEGVEDQITDTGWTRTFRTSPDIYSRLFILDDPVQGVLDAGYLLAP